MRARKWQVRNSSNYLEASQEIAFFLLGRRFSDLKVRSVALQSLARKNKKNKFSLVLCSLIRIFAAY